MVEKILYLQFLSCSGLICQIDVSKADSIVIAVCHVESSKVQYRGSSSFSLLKKVFISSEVVLELLVDVFIFSLGKSWTMELVNL